MKKENRLFYIFLVLSAVVIVIGAWLLIPRNEVKTSKTIPPRLAELAPVQELIKSGKLKDASAKLAELATANPDNQDIPSMQGTILLLQSKPQEAAPFLEKAFTLGSRERSLLLKLGEVYLLTGQSEKLKSGLPAVEDTAVKKYFNGLLAIQAKNNKDALSTLKEAESDLKDYYPFQVNLADCYRRANDKENAYQHYKTAFQLQPNLTHVGVLLADYSIEKKQTREALGYLEAVRKVNPYIIDIYHKSGDIYMASKQYPEARENFQKMSDLAFDLKDKIKMAYAELQLGVLDSAQGQLEKADAHIKKALENDPTNRKAIESAASVSFVRKKYDETVKYASQTIQADPYNTNCVYLLGMSYFYLGDKDKAKIALAPLRQQDKYKNLDEIKKVFSDNQ